MSWREVLKERAMNAIDKKAPYGIDIDLRKYSWEVPESIVVDNLKALPKPLLERSKAMGVDVDERSVSGTYFQLDTSVIRTYVTERFRKYGVYVMSIEEALRKFSWARDYYWRAIPVDLDKYTAITELYGRHGYFIYVPPGIKVHEPLQACLFIHREGTAQAVHNIVIVDEGAELNLMTACAALPTRAIHIGVSEFYVKRNAKLTFTMVHYWGPTHHVRPRATAIVEDGGSFINYYIHMAPVRSLQMFPTAILKGANAQAYLTTILIGGRNAHIDVGGRIVFKGPNTRGEVASRSLIKDNAHVIMRGELIGETLSRGHIDCKGLLLSPKAIGEAIPILKSINESAELTHEAAIGRISRDELEYLMTKGFTEDEAVSLIVRGFLEVGIERLPSTLRRYVSNVLDVITKYAKG